jgi:hypothetical protein
VEDPLAADCWSLYMLLTGSPLYANPIHTTSFLCLVSPQLPGITLQLILSCWQAPEVVRGAVEDPLAADCWSLGVCLYMLLTGSPLYSDPWSQPFALLESGQAALLLARYALGSK